MSDAIDKTLLSGKENSKVNEKTLELEKEIASAPPIKLINLTNWVKENPLRFLTPKSKP